MLTPPPAEPILNVPSLPALPLSPIDIGYVFPVIVPPVISK